MSRFCINSLFKELIITNFLLRTLKTTFLWPKIHFIKVKPPVLWKNVALFYRTAYKNVQLSAVYVTVIGLVVCEGIAPWRRALLAGSVLREREVFAAAWWYAAMLSYV